MVVGATSGAGKSTVTAGLCRSWFRRGVSVAPFKAQNMSNHSAVAVGRPGADGVRSYGEVGRAQAFQALAAGVDVEVAMNPILLKPTQSNRSHVVVRGMEVGRTDAAGWGDRTRELRSVVLDDLVGLRHRFDVVVCEGAGGAAEINLLDRDLVNLPLAAAAGIGSVLVVDIERGGAFAAAFGTLALLPERLRDTVGGVIFNRFRGDPSLLDPGIRELEERTGVPVLGVLPFLNAPLFGVEDSLDMSDPVRAPSSSTNPLRIAVVGLPHLANPSDMDPLVAEPDVAVIWANSPGALIDADVVILPGSRNTVADLTWMRQRGIDAAVSDHARRGGCVVGICAGAQMLGRTIVDGIESDVPSVEGLALLAIETRFEPEKVVRRRTGLVGNQPVSGYQIHQGRLTGGPAWVRLEDRPDTEIGWEDDGAIGHDDRVSATTLHGIFDSDEFRGAWLTATAERFGRAVEPSATGFAERLDDQAEHLADWVDDHLERDLLDAITERAVTAGAEPGW